VELLCRKLRKHYSGAGAAAGGAGAGAAGGADAAGADEADGLDDVYGADQAEGREEVPEEEYEVGRRGEGGSGWADVSYAREHVELAALQVTDLPVIHCQRSRCVSHTWCSAVLEHLHLLAADDTCAHSILGRAHMLLVCSDACSAWPALSMLDLTCACAAPPTG
jgi:hypothetical protein